MTTEHSSECHLTEAQLPHEDGEAQWLSLTFASVLSTPYEPSQEQCGRTISKIKGLLSKARISCNNNSPKLVFSWPSWCRLVIPSVWDSEKGEWTAQELPRLPAVEFKGSLCK